MFFKIKIKYNDIIIMTIPYSKQQPPPINQLPNVNISESLVDGEVLTYNEATEEWINGTAGGGGGTEIVATDNLRSLNAGTPTGTGNILLGLNAGSANPASNGLVCIGMNALPVASTNISDSVIIGENAGLIATRTNRNVLIGSEVVNTLTISYTDDAVVIGYDAGGIRIANSVVIGSEANKTGYSVRSVIIGQDAARSTLAIDQVIIGTNAKSLNGNTNGDNKNVIIGDYSGERQAGGSNVIIGSSAGKGTTNYNCNRATIVGQDACKNSGGKESITAIGQASGYNNAGQNSTYLGKSAGVDGGNYANTIVISAETAGLNPTSANSCFISPIRAVDLKIGTDLLYYNSTTKELQRSSTDITKFYANFASATTFTTAQAPIIFTNAPYNINSGYNTGTGVFTASINGYYQFSIFYGLGQGDDITLNWEVNGIIDKSDVRHSPSGGGSGIRTFETTWMGVLGAGDTLEINIFAISGTIYFGTAGEGLRGVYIGK